MPLSISSPAASAKATIRRDADADDDEIDRDFATIRQSRGADSMLAVEALKPGAFDHLDAMTSMQFAEIGAGFGCGDTLQDSRRRFDQRDLETEFGGNRRGLKPDIAAPDDQQAATRLNSGFIRSTSAKVRTV